MTTKVIITIIQEPVVKFSVGAFIAVALVGGIAHKCTGGGVASKPVDLGLSVEWTDYSSWGKGRTYYWGTDMTVDMVRERWDKTLEWIYTPEDWGTKYDKLADYIGGGTKQGYPLPKNLDPVHKMGGRKWRMPTIAEAEELIENCTLSEEVQKGGFIDQLGIEPNTIGIRLTSTVKRHTKKSIFIACPFTNSDRYSSRVRCYTYIWLSEASPKANYAAALELGFSYDRDPRHPEDLNNATIYQPRIVYLRRDTPCNLIGVK